MLYSLKILGVISMEDKMEDKVIEEKDMIEEKITKDMNITEVVQKYPDTFFVLMQVGMGCFGCAAASFETIEEGAMAHGIDADALCEILNEVIGASDESESTEDSKAL